MATSNWLIITFVLLLLSVVLVSGKSERLSLSPPPPPPLIFNFGDSNSDTGGLKAGLGVPVNSPNGLNFFRRSTGRFCDGRLLIDFLCQTVNSSYLTPYLDSLLPDFTNGANFAIAGAATLPPFLAFSLNIQVMQFIRFKTRALEIAAAGSVTSRIIKEVFPTSQSDFSCALYMIDIGQNDLSHAFANLTYSEVIAQIPTVLEQIKSAIRNLYSEGGRNFWVHNTGPLGCLPQKMSMFGAKYTDRDKNGCLQAFNDACVTFNTGLRSACYDLRSELINSTIVYVDMYKIKYDLITNYASYGFENPLMACCGYGGPPYNFNDQVRCSNSGYVDGKLVTSKVCKESSRYLSWDGIHYSEAANAIIASKMLSGNYSEPLTSQFIPCAMCNCNQSG